jgi:hypothetical protein
MTAALLDSESEAAIQPFKVLLLPTIAAVAHPLKEFIAFVYNIIPDFAPKVQRELRPPGP